MVTTRLNRRFLHCDKIGIQSDLDLPPSELQVCLQQRNTMDSFRIEVIKAEDVDGVIAFLKERFFKVGSCRWFKEISFLISSFHCFQDEPLNSSLDLGDCPELEHFCRSGLDSGLSLKVIDELGTIIGVAVNSKVKRGEVEDDSVYRGHEKFYKIIQVSEHAAKQVDLFGKHPEVNEYLEAKVLSVSADYRCQGIGKLLVNARLKLMEDLGIPVFYIQCSSYFAARIMEKSGFEEAFTMPYKEFLVIITFKILGKTSPN